MTAQQPGIVIRPLQWEDLPAALAIQATAYPAFLIEEEAAFASRLDLPDSCCLAATGNGELIAYLLAHGWPTEAPPPVGAVLTVAQKSEVLFIHDLAVSPAARGTGVGQLLLARACEIASQRGWPRAELIAVEGAAAYWDRLGFSEGEVSVALAAAVVKYGAGARWMTRPI